MKEIMNPNESNESYYYHHGPFISLQQLKVKLFNEPLPQQSKQYLAVWTPKSYSCPVVWSR